MLYILCYFAGLYEYTYQYRNASNKCSLFLNAPLKQKTVPLESGYPYGDPLVSFEITLMNPNMSLKLNSKLNLTLKLNVNLSLKIEFEIEFEFEFELEFRFEFEIEFKIQINFEF